MAEVTRRYRVNISTSVKGIKTHDSTVEISTTDVDEYISVSGEDATVIKDNLGELIRHLILAESDALVAELDKRYPPQIEEIKEVKK